MPDPDPPTYFVVFHTPGPQWVQGKSYDEQAGFQTHVRYMDECFERGVIVMSGPFLERAGGMAPGGMAIFQCADFEEARALGTADPTVQSGLLKVDVKPWAVVFHR